MDGKLCGHTLAFMGSRGAAARPADTTAEVWDRQMAIFASMTPAERLRLTNQLSIDLRRLSQSAQPGT